ncbi:MAG: helix-hairpin-helix domain-containing protein [Firmicutes bacterium]|nr:helix-hairpin-helix domain-containing protein [Dethiobacter sp.]MBS3889439.1 helix-hairpin-helix domain-containing protein [Bacillota bacterium]MBS4054869.1 helix-hairpin-helix domain-containing protein [Thermaerobacter sp.]
MSRNLVLALACGLALSLMGNIFLYRQLQQSPEVIYVEAPKSQEAPATSALQAPVVVHVSGAVNRPSVYTLAAGSRAMAAIEAAGGAVADADLERINLARVLADGEQLHISRRGEQSPTTSTPTSPTPGNVRININTATQAELETLPGIGPTRALAIIAYRQQRGPFANPEDLMNVSGIGEKTYEGLQNLIRVR